MEYIYCKIEINNMPRYYEHGYVVARRDADASLWFYSIYQVKEKAHEVAVEIGNGIVLEV